MEPLAVGAVAQSFWWIGIAVFVLAVVPAVVLLADRIVSATRRIREAAEEVAEGAERVEENLAAIARFESVRAVAEQAGERGRRLAEIRTRGH